MSRSINKKKTHVAAGLLVMKGEYKCKTAGCYVGAKQRKKNCILLLQIVSSLNGISGKTLIVKQVLFLQGEFLRRIGKVARQAQERGDSAVKDDFTDFVISF